MSEVETDNGDIVKCPPAPVEGSRPRRPRGGEKTCYNCGEVRSPITFACMSMRWFELTFNVFSLSLGLSLPRSLSFWSKQAGHIARDCQNPRLEGEARQVINKARAQYRRCFNCGKLGHISADCTKPAGNKACYNCGKEGHIAKECPAPKASE